jgi:hypothetical protein
MRCFHYSVLFAKHLTTKRCTEKSINAAKERKRWRNQLTSQVCAHLWSFLTGGLCSLLRCEWRSDLAACYARVILGWQENVDLTLPSRHDHDCKIWRGSSGNLVPGMKTTSLIPQDADRISFSLHRRRFHPETTRVVSALKTMEKVGVASGIIKPLKRL